MTKKMINKMIDNLYIKMLYIENGCAGYGDMAKYMHLYTRLKKRA